MPNVFKRFLSGGEADDYVFKPASELRVEPQKPAREAPAAEEPAEPAAPEEAAAQEPTPETDPLGFAQVQANAILADAREEAEHYKETARAEFEAELEEAKKAARDEGYSRGYAEGMAQAMQEGKEERGRMALEQVKAIESFLEGAARARDRMLDDAREELKDLAVAVAEKVIHVSLKNSSDIILRMVDAATDTHKRCEWAHIYVADCDVGGKAYTVPELTAALSHIADRVRVIPMPDEESGTCIVEMPDVILDASVSTQLGNIKETLDGVVLEDD
ncbi:MAG: F0F1 ATP synthase subunit delta [Oscillospiraceae bacterium]|nr:F0F1 ATP synthase subunit delta [Oscillospiraceae bacterium]